MELNFEDEISGTFALKDSLGKVIDNIEIAITCNSSGMPEIEIGKRDEDGLFLGTNYNLKITFDELLRAAAENFLDGRYERGCDLYKSSTHIQLAYLHMSNALRFQAKLMEIKAKQIEITDNIKNNSGKKGKEND